MKYYIEINKYHDDTYDDIVEVIPELFSYADLSNKIGHIEQIFTSKNFSREHWLNEMKNPHVWWSDSISQVWKEDESGVIQVVKAN